MDDLRIFLLVPVGFVLIGSLLAWLGIRSRRDLRRFKRRARRAEALCVRLITEWRSGHGDDAPSPIHYPVVRFRLPDGREVETRTAWGSSPAPAREGATCTVLYDPQRPEVARVEGFWGDGTLVHTLLVVVGSGVALFGAAGLAVGLLIMSQV